MSKLNKRRSKFFKALRIPKLPYLPFCLNIETGNICNLKCPLCPTGSDQPGLKKGFMEMSLFKQALDQLGPVLQTINLYSWGEPLLNKNFIDFVRYIKSYNRNIRTITSTNLNIKDRKLLEDLIASGMDEIIVSCDGASEETYLKYRKGGNFQLVVDNLKLLIKKNAEFGQRSLIVWNFLVFRHNEHEVEKARSIAESLGAQFRVGLMRTSMKDEILKPHKETIRKDLDWIPDSTEYSAYDKENLTTKKEIKSCRKPWQEITVNWDGKIFPCCAIFEGKYNYGSIINNTIKSIWNNHKYILARNEISTQKKPPRTICGICKSNGFMHF